MTQLGVYRDDGPLALWIGATLGRPLPSGGAPLALLGAVLLGIALAVAEPPGPGALVAVALGACVLLASMGARHPEGGRFAWIAPPLLRALEYAFLIRLTLLEDPDALPLCFALLAVLAFHHYDAVYRLRQQGAAPPAWTRVAGGGWECRMIVAFVLAALGVLGPGVLVLALALAALWVGESVSSWTRYARAERPAVIDDEEGQDE